MQRARSDPGPFCWGGQPGVGWREQPTRDNLKALPIASRKPVLTPAVPARPVTLRRLCQIIAVALLGLTVWTLTSMSGVTPASEFAPLLYGVMAAIGLLAFVLISRPRSASFSWRA